MDTEEQELVEAIAQATDRVGPCLALAEWLRSRDDPAARGRAELIELGVKIEAAAGSPALERRVRQLVKAHADTWTDGLVSRLGLDVRFRLGFVDAFTIGSDAEGLRQEACSTFQELFEHPAFRFAREARVGVFGESEEIGDQNGVYAAYDLSDFFAAMPDVFYERPAPFEAISLGFPDGRRFRPRGRAGRSRRFRSASAAITIADAARLLPQLSRLSLRCRLDDRWTLAELAPRLVELELRPADFFDPHGVTVLSDVARCHWSRLESLSIGRSWYDDWAKGGLWGRQERCDPEELRPVLDGEAAPRLGHLALTESALADDVCAALSASRVARQLETLSLARGALTSQGVHALVDGAAGFERLTRLDVQGCGLEAADLAALRDAFPAAAVAG